jgi:hypoxanthine phosphoribosyltransferase
MNKLVIDNYHLDDIIATICRDITNSSWRPDYVVGLTRGGLCPAVMISHYFNIPCETLKVSLRDGGEPESNLWMAEDAFNKKKILIVDDINDSGATINWIMEDWPSGCFPNNAIWNEVWNNNVKFAVLVDNLASKCNVKIDYVGMEINKEEKDVWVEFPWEKWWGRSQ